MPRKSTKPSNQTLLEASLKPFRGLGPDVIAKQLEQAGLKGRPATTTCCPLALLLATIHNGNYYIGQTYILRVSGKDVAKVPTPYNLATFQKRFDSCQYPSLILPPPRVTGGREYGTKKAPRKGKAPQKRRSFFYAKQVGRV